jgi:uncharacterized protein YceK
MRRVLLCLILTVAMVGCSRTHKAAIPALPKTDTVMLCKAVNTARNDIMVPHKAGSFTDLVNENHPTVVNAGVSSVFQLTHPTKPGALGPYAPAIDYLVARNLAWTPEFAADNPMPKRTAEVISSAKRLDADLESGLCR